LPDIDVAGTVMEAGAAGGMIWQPVVSVVHPLFPATPTDLTL
jgi:hypothetical protein